MSGICSSSSSPCNFIPADQAVGINALEWLKPTDPLYAVDQKFKEMIDHLGSFLQYQKQQLPDPIPKITTSIMLMATMPIIYCAVVINLVGVRIPSMGIQLGSLIGEEVANLAKKVYDIGRDKLASITAEEKKQHDLIESATQIQEINHTLSKDSLLLLREMVVAIDCRDLTKSQEPEILALREEFFALMQLLNDKIQAIAAIQDEILNLEVALEPNQHLSEVVVYDQSH